MGHTDLKLITEAAAFAAEAHREQKRKSSDQPYINHLVRVAAHAAKAGLSPEAIAAAYLHDVVEDTPVSWNDLHARFPDRVVQLVRLLTKDWPDDAPSEIKHKGKPPYYAAIGNDPDAATIKLLDRADNLMDMKNDLDHIRGWAGRYAKKTRKEIAEIFEACTNHYAREVYSRALEALEEALRFTGGSGGSRDR